MHDLKRPMKWSLLTLFFHPFIFHLTTSGDWLCILLWFHLHWFRFHFGLTLCLFSQIWWPCMKVAADPTVHLTHQSVSYCCFYNCWFILALTLTRTRHSSFTAIWFQRITLKSPCSPASGIMHSRHIAWNVAHITWHEVLLAGMNYCQHYQAWAGISWHKRMAWSIVAALMPTSCLHLCRLLGNVGFIAALHWHKNVSSWHSGWRQ